MLKVAQRRINLQELIENRTEIFKMLAKKLQEYHELTEQETPLYGVDTERKTVALHCYDINQKLL